MNHETPITRTVVDSCLKTNGIGPLGRSSIREIVQLVSQIEAESGQTFIRMEMGVPGLSSPALGPAAQIEALSRGVSAQYPVIDGLPALKEETARFARLFLDISIKPAGCIPVVGAMQGAFATFMVANRNDRTRKGTLFLDPGFPVQKQQCTILGHEYDSFDISEFRGERLRGELERHLREGLISSILYSNPNNPSWMCLDEEELRIIGELASRYDVTVIEDLAYLGMDFRKDYSRPGTAPYQPTVARYTDNWVLLISTSKMFSYAGERLGLLLVSDALFDRSYPDLLRYYNTDRFGRALVYGALYALSAGTGHSAQYAVAAMLKAANDGEMNFVAVTREYGRRAAIMKELFTDNGFRIVYDHDRDQAVADGFFFTISYPGMDGDSLMKELLYYGISAMGLAITGSAHPEGLRACVSRFSYDQAPVLADRLRRFRADHPTGPESTS